MAMKCVAQMPHPVAAPASPTHVARRYPRVARARRNRLTATRLARKQTTPASATRRRSCSPPRQDRTRNMLVPYTFAKAPPRHVCGGSGPRGEIERRLAAHAAAGGEILLGADTAAGPGIDQHDIERLQLVTDELCSR